MRRSPPRGTHPLIVLILLAGCAAPALTVAPTSAERPPVPEGWHLVTADAGDVRMALPADVDAIFTGAGIIAQERNLKAPTPFEVIVVGPADVVPQPRGDEPIRAWLEQSWLPVAGVGGVTAVGDDVERQVALPSGAALEIGITAQPGTPDESRVVLYAIATDEGIAIIRILGSPARMAERADQLRLIALLAEFGDLSHLP